MQDEHRGVGGGLIEFFEGRHAFFGELEFVPATDHAHPLRCWRAVGLGLEHAQRVGQGRYAFPAQLEVVIEPATDQVQVRVVEARNHRALVQVDDLRGRAALGHDLGVGAHGDEFSAADGHGTGLGFFLVHRVEITVEENQIDVHRASVGRRVGRPDSKAGGRHGRNTAAAAPSNEPLATKRRRSLEDG